MKVRTTEQQDERVVKALQILHEQVSDACPEQAGVVWASLIEAMLYLDGPDRELVDTLADALVWEDHDRADYGL